MYIHIFRFDLLTKSHVNFFPCPFTTAVMGSRSLPGHGPCSNTDSFKFWLHSCVDSYSSSQFVGFHLGCLESPKYTSLGGYIVYPNRGCLPGFCLVKHFSTCTCQSSKKC